MFQAEESNGQMVEIGEQARGWIKTAATPFFEYFIFSSGHCHCGVSLLRELEWIIW